MKKWNLTVLFVVAMLVSFLCGGISLVAMIHISALSREDPMSRLERLQGEAAVFFYDTMRELFLGTYDQQKNHVSAEALEVFNTHRARLESKCWLVNTKEVYGAFWGEALFPSGDVIEVCMQKTDKGWVLSLLNHMGTEYFFHDLSEAKQATTSNEEGNRQITVGIDGKGAAGRFFFDDIRLPPRERQLITPTEPNTTGLVAYYQFEKDGTDSSGQGNHGTVVGNPPWVAGKIGNAVKLDGGRDYIDCGNSPSLNIRGPMTIAAWIHPTGPGGGGFGRLLDKSSGTSATDPGYKIYHRAMENYIMTLSIGGGERRSSTGLVLNTWNFFGFVATGIQWKLCLNGAWQVCEDTHLPTMVANPLYIGNGSSAGRHFQGMLDEVRIYNRALTPGEIAWLSGRTKPFDMPF